MIKTEYFRLREDGVALYRTYSDTGYLIRQEQTGAEYSEAIDVADAPYTYIETDTEINDELAEVGLEGLWITPAYAAVQ